MALAVNCALAFDSIGLVIILEEMLAVPHPADEVLAI